MGICAQQHRVCIGLFAASAGCYALKQSRSSFDWIEAILNCLALARAALYLFLYIVIFMYGLIEINNYCESNYVDSTPTPKYPLIYSLLGLCDLIIFWNFFCKFKFKLPICKVLLTVSCFTLFFLNLLLVIISNPSLVNPGPVKLQRLTVYYQNVQGFVDPGKGLTDPCPVLNLNKLT